jgi:chemotaxis protein MotA
VGSLARPLQAGQGALPPVTEGFTPAADQPGMKPATGIGIGVAAAGILLSAVLEGTSPASFIDIPALMIILCGTGGVTLASVGMEAMKRVPELYKRVFTAEPPDITGRVELLVSLAEQARREGLLALDAKVNEIDDEFTRKGLQLVVDGIDPDLVREVLEAEIDGMIARHHAGAQPFEKAGGFAPTMGIIGTVMGLVHVLQNLAAPSTLGPAISAAFIATLMGVGSANVVFLPIANRLKALSGEEVELRTLTLDGILAVQAGDNPRVVAEKLNSYIAPFERESEDSAEVTQMPDREAEAA